MADHLVAKFRGLCGALAVALLTLALIAPAGAEASGPGLDALSQLSNVVPAPAQAAVAAALAQVPSPSRVESVPSATAAIPAPAPSAQTVGPSVATPAGNVPAVAVLVPPAPRPDIANSAPTISVPTVSVRTTGKRPNPPARARPDTSLGGQASAHRVSHPKGRRAGQRGLRRPARPAPTRPGPIGAVGSWWAPVPPAHAVLVHAHHATAARAPSRARRRSDGPRHLAARPSGAVSTVSTPQLGPPVSANLPPGGAEGAAAGVGGGMAGAAAVALLAVVGVCMLRALLPGLLGLGLAPARSALLVSRLERPG
jgi:hypothetical protein